MDIIKIKMMKDLLSMSNNYMDEINRHDPSIDRDEYSNWIKHKIHTYIDQTNISFTRGNNMNSKNRCTARLWNGGQGEKQCTHQKTTTEYCEKHNTMLSKEGVLRFGDIRDDRPPLDLIKKKNNIIEKLHWIDPDPLSQVQDVLDNQQRKVICCGHKLIVN